MIDMLTNESFGGYPQTQWTEVILAAQSGDKDKARGALTVFCESYRRAVFNFFLRRIGTHKAEDYTQEFFIKKIYCKWEEEGGLLFNAVRQPGGRFRSLLATALHRFLIDQLRSRKNPIDHAVSAVPEDIGQDQTEMESQGDWDIALEILNKVRDRLKIPPVYLRYYNKELRGKQAAQELKISYSLFRKTAAELKRSIRKEFLEEVRRIVSSECEVEEEARELKAILARYRNIID